VTFAHVGGLPLEETIAAGGPALLTALGALGAQLRARRIGRRQPMSDRPSLTPPNDRGLDEDAAPGSRADRYGD
jgi:hypothetical protein